jgi:hypothetical protein
MSGGGPEVAGTSEKVASALTAPALFSHNGRV